jgi:hypothetical protein
MPGCAEPNRPRRIAPAQAQPQPDRPWASAQFGDFTLGHVKSMPAWLRYTLLRLLFIAVPLAVLLILFGTQYWLYWTIASVIAGFALSYIFLGRTREQMSIDMAEARAKPPVAKGDDAVEDAEIARSEPTDGD